MSYQLVDELPSWLHANLAVFDAKLITNPVPCIHLCYTSVAPIIGSVIGIGQYRALTGISAVYLDLVYRYLVKHEI